MNKKYEQTVQNRVKRGAKLLDTYVPKWWNKVKIKTLDMDEPCRCVLGQTYDGQYTDGLDKLGCIPGVKKTEYSYRWADAVYYGFDFDHTKENFSQRVEYSMLQDEWLKEIRKRKKKNVKRKR